MSESKEKKRRNDLVRALMNVKGELFLLKREQKKLEDKLEDVLRSHASLATMLHEERLLLQDLLVGAERAQRPRLDVGLRQAA